MARPNRVGFVGLGIMGRPMAQNVLKSGFPLSVFNRTRSKMDDLAAQGARACRDLAELAEHSDIVITMLPDSPEVEEVILSDHGLLPHLRPEMVVIDMSSIAPLVSQKIGRILAEKGVHFLDAPVSGGESGAVEGTLAIMVGGEREIFQRCLPLLQTMGKNVVHVGPVGSGNFTKLANQIIVALNIAAVGEAFVLAQKAGLDPDVVYQAIRGGLAGSRVLDAKAPLIMARQFEPGFKLKLHNKDLNNVMKTARELELSLPLAEKVKGFIEELCQSGEGELDHGAIVHYVEKLTGVQIRKKMV